MAVRTGIKAPILRLPPWGPTSRRLPATLRPEKEATAAIKKATRELLPHQRKKLLVGGFEPKARIVSPARAAKDVGDLAIPGRKIAAYSSTPRISFVVDRQKLLSGKTTHGSIGTARHEIAHLLPIKRFGGQSDTPASHLTIKAAGAEASGVGLRHVPGVHREPTGRKITKAFQRIRRPKSRISAPTGVSSTYNSKKKIQRPPGYDPVVSRIKQKYARRFGLDY